MGFTERQYVPGEERFEIAHVLRPDIPGVFEQHEVPGVAHSGDANETRFGKVPWMSRKLASGHYARIFAIRTPRPAGEADNWIANYQRIRRMMGLGQTIDLRDDFYISYPQP